MSQDIHAAIAAYAEQFTKLNEMNEAIHAAIKTQAEELRKLNSEATDMVKRFFRQHYPQQKDLQKQIQNLAKNIPPVGLPKVVEKQMMEAGRNCLLQQQNILKKIQNFAKNNPPVGLPKVGENELLGAGSNFRLQLQDLQKKIEQLGKTERARGK